MTNSTQTDHQATQEKKRAALSSLAAAVLLTGLKLVTGILTGSLGILAEAAHSALDLVAAGVTFLAIRIASRPADRRHPYGHGKVENLSAMVETLLLLLTCGWIINEAVDRLLHEHEPIKLSVWAFAVMGVSIVVDFSRARLLGRVAKKHKSQALEADALHFSTDILSSMVVIFGLGAVWASDFVQPGTLLHSALLRADAAAALVVAFIVAVVSLRLGKRAVDTLLDAGNAQNMKLVEAAVATVPEVLRISRLRLRESGPESFVDMEIILPMHLNLTEAHTVTHKVEDAVRQVLGKADITIHSEPESEYGPVDYFARIRNAALRHSLDVHAVEVDNAGATTFISLHAEVDGSLPLCEAHARAEAFEKDIRHAGCEVLTHIEPRRTWVAGEATLQSPDSGDCLTVEKSIRELLSGEKEVSKIHRLRLLECGDMKKLTFHCCLPGDMTVRDSHRLVSRLEALLWKNCPGIRSVSIHMEPEEWEKPSDTGEQNS